MKKETELFWGLFLAGGTWLMDHYAALLSGMIGTVALAVWLLKLRREWRHRNDKPED